jgi:Fur family ferric uptake transcriptional regulator/Fur family peroxide stress response transcriptional regulator
MTVDDFRLTPQRRAVLDVVAASHDHPTAADVLQRVRAVVPEVGAATVYRTLSLLVESGQVAELRLGHGNPTRYDREVHRHGHLLCEGCGTVVDVRVDVSPQLIEETARPYGFEVSTYDLRVLGRCAACRETAPPAPHPLPKETPHG